mmetsp:Transcript_31401/g.71086  ORF Transcript_31401/g.71086 Transcript_31401/m.71086 type:complete len:225 (+) Transcript_31401:202-876(+)
MLAAPTKARLMRELGSLAKDPPPGIAAYCPDSDITQIRAQISGPEGSPFEGGVFLLTVSIAGRYPFEPPRCRFITPLYHPNVDSGGRICLDTLKSPPAGSWSPAVGLPSLLLSIRSLMAEPNPDDALVPELADFYKRDLKGWEREARRRTALDATTDKLEKAESVLNGEVEQGEGAVAENGEGKDEDAVDAKTDGSAAGDTTKEGRPLEEKREENGREAKRTKC